MFDRTIINIFSNIWPMLVIVMTIVISIRMAYLFINKSRFVLYRDLLLLMFIIYVMCLFYVVTFQDVSWSTSNFIPFKEMLRYRFGSYMFFKNIIGNMLMFIPYGFFVSWILKNKNLFITFLLSFIASLSIESTQLLIGRVFDVDDILLNVVGGCLGFSLYCLLDKLKTYLPEILKKTYIYNIIVIVVFSLLILYILSIIANGV